MRKIKKMPMKLLFVLVLAITSFGFASAEVLDLDKCIEIALQNNFGLLAAKNSYDIARVQTLAAYGNILPQASISASGRKSWPVQDYVDPNTGQITSSEYSYSGSLNLSQSYSGLGVGTYANIRQASHQKSSAYYDYVTARNNLVQTVKENYYGLLKSKMLVDVAQDAVKRGEERLRVVQSRYDLGSASMSDVLKAKVQFGNDRLDLVTKTNTYQIARANLAFTMGVDVTLEYEVAEDLPERNIEFQFQDALAEALNNNPEYRKANYDLKSAKDGKLLAFSRFLPSLSLGLSHNTSVDQSGDLFNFNIDDASYSAYASLNFNLFNNFADYATYRAANRNIDTQKKNLSNTSNAVALALRQAHLDLMQSEESRKLADEALAAAQEDLNLVKEKYNLGAATILEVLDAEVSLKEAQTNKVQALYDFNLAVSRLEKTLGR